MRGRKDGSEKSVHQEREGRNREKKKRIMKGENKEGEEKTGKLINILPTTKSPKCSWGGHRFSKDRVLGVHFLPIHPPKEYF